MRTPGTRSARRLSGAAATVLALALAPAATASNGPVQLSFMKDCPVLTCTGSLLSPSGEPIPGSHVSSEIAPVWFSDAEDIVHYTSVETISARRGEFTMQLLGIADYTTDPTVTHVIGTVQAGSWRGRDLTNASITIVASRAFATTFRGVIRLRPAG
jgi:hypothetical protein